MPTDPIADRARAPEAGCALAALADGALDPLFRPQARSGVASAWHAHVPFAQWLVSAIRPALIVELGTHNGVSYAAFCETVLHERLPTRCYAVDSWDGDDHAGHYDESVYTTLRDFHDGRYSAFSELLRMTFDEARAVIADGTVDLLHIDGFHSYEAVRHDFESWAPKLSHRSVVLFHDINVLERGFGVARFWAEVAVRFPSFAFLHGHGLGVLAAGTAPPPAVGRLCEETDPSALALLRERFAYLGRVHGLDYARQETARREQRLQEESAGRDAVIDDLRRSLAEVLGHRDKLLSVEAMASERIPALETMIAGLRQSLSETQAALSDSQEHAARLAARLPECDRIIDEMRAQAATDAAQLARLQAEMEALWDHLAAARADARAAREAALAAVAPLQAASRTDDDETPDPAAARRSPIWMRRPVAQRRV